MAAAAIQKKMGKRQFDWHKCDGERLCVEYADKIFIFAVLERWLLQLRETDSSFVLYMNMTRTGSRWTIIQNIWVNSKVISFASYRIMKTQDTDIHTQRTDCTTWTTKVVRYRYIYLRLENRI